MLVVAYLGFTGLNNNYFWDDEATVATFAKNLITDGNAAHTSRYLHTFREGGGLNENLKPRNPPLTRHIAALSMRIFGIKTWAARLPFVFIGLATLALLWAALRIDFAAFPYLQRYAFTLTALSYSFLLNIRQCQYYAPSLFGAVGTWLFYRLTVKRGRPRDAIGLGAFLILLFNANYLLGGAVILSVGITHLADYLVARKTTNWRMLLYAVAAFLLVAIPQVLITHAWVRPDIRTADSGLFTRPVLLFWNLRELDTINYLPLPILLLFLLFFWRYRRKAYSPSVTMLYLSMFLSMVAVISFASPQPAPWSKLTTGLADVRYLLPVLPFAAVLIAYVLHLIHRGLGGLVAITLTLILLSSNLLSLRISFPAMRLLLPAFVYEIHHDYETPYEAAVAYLKSHAKQDDIVTCAPAYPHDVMEFYLGDKILVGGMLTEKTRLPRQKLAGISLPIYYDQYYPDWLVTFGLNKWNKEEFDHFSRGEYEYRQAAVLKVHCKDMTRPELPWHSFREPPHPSDPAQAVHILKRVPKTVGQAVSSHSAPSNQ